jgi:Concanavalin A-like lectin/glucanases superfamily/Immunoglobulin domain
MNLTSDLYAGLAVSAVLAFSFGSPAPAQAADCDPPPSGMVGWWKGEGNANDSVSTNNGTLSPTGGSYAPGMVGQGFRFDGANGYVQIPDSDALKPTNVTIEAWVWLDPELPANNVGEQVVFKKNTWSAWFEGYSLSKQPIDNGDGTYSNHFQFCVSRNGDQVAINSQTIVQRGVWYHVAATYDGTQSTLFVNGVADASATPGFALDYGTDPVFIGTTGTWPPYLNMFGGIIDEVSIYSRALSSSEIAAIYNAGSAGKCYGPFPPTIVSQPASQSVAEGAEADLSVVATGSGPFAYQWVFNGNSLPGATNAELAVTNIHPVQAGNYVVKVSSPDGSVTSSNAVVTVVKRNVLIYTYSGTEKITTAGSETAYAYSGRMFYYPHETNGVFVGWATISGRKQYWTESLSDFLLIPVTGSPGRVYSLLGRAGQGLDGNGQPHLWSDMHKGLNTKLTIATKTTVSFPSTFAFTGLRAYADPQTGKMTLREATSTYVFSSVPTQTANNGGKTWFDLVSTLSNDLAKQGYRLQP